MPPVATGANTALVDARNELVAHHAHHASGEQRSEHQRRSGAKRLNGEIGEHGARCAEEIVRHAVSGGVEARILGRIGEDGAQTISANDTRADRERGPLQSEARGGGTGRGGDSSPLVEGLVCH
jgi:hypothetical protein